MEKFKGFLVILILLVVGFGIWFFFIKEDKDVSEFDSNPDYDMSDVTNVPVIRPVACLDKLEIIAISKKIDTYETSIQPYEDCCTIFLPKHPVINPKIELAKKYEESFDFESLIDEAVKTRDVIKINNIDKFDF